MDRWIDTYINAYIHIYIYQEKLDPWAYHRRTQTAPRLHNRRGIVEVYLYIFVYGILIYHNITNTYFILYIHIYHIKSHIYIYIYMYKSGRQLGIWTGTSLWPPLVPSRPLLPVLAPSRPPLSPFSRDLRIFSNTYLENPFWELLPKLHFSTGIAEFKKNRRKPKKNSRQSSILPKYGFHRLFIFVRKAESKQFRRNCGQFRRNLGQFRRHFFWFYWSKVSIINSAEISLQWWNSAESRFLERNLKIPPKS